MTKTLEELRKEIDELDQRLLEILGKRMATVKKIGVLKKVENLPLVDEKRREELLELIIRRAEKLGLSEEFIKKLYTTIHDHAVKIQASIEKS